MVLYTFRELRFIPFYSYLNSHLIKSFTNFLKPFWDTLCRLLVLFKVVVHIDWPLVFYSEMTYFMLFWCTTKFSLNELVYNTCKAAKLAPHLNTDDRTILVLLSPVWSEPSLRAPCLPRNVAVKQLQLYNLSVIFQLFYFLSVSVN